MDEAEEDPIENISENKQAKEESVPQEQPKTNGASVEVNELGQGDEPHKENAKISEINDSKVKPEAQLDEEKQQERKKLKPESVSLSNDSTSVTPQVPLAVEAVDVAPTI